MTATATATATAAAPRLRTACLCAGLLLAGLPALALICDTRAEPMFLHSLGIFMIADLAPLLIVLGLPRSSPARSRQPRILAHPLIAVPLWAIAVGVWHVPALYEAALDDAGVQALQCVTLFACGLNLWMCLAGSSPAPRWFGERARIGAVLVSRVLAVTLANLLLWSDAVFYPYYAHGDALDGLSPLADQNIAGAILLAQEALVTLGLLCWLAVRAASRGGTVAQPATRPRGAEPATGAYGHGEAVL